MQLQFCTYDKVIIKVTFLHSGHLKIPQAITSLGNLCCKLKVIFKTKIYSNCDKTNIGS